MSSADSRWTNTSVDVFDILQLVTGGVLVIVVLPALLIKLWTRRKDSFNAFWVARFVSVCVSILWILSLLLSADYLFGVNTDLVDGGIVGASTQGTLCRLSFLLTRGIAEPFFLYIVLYFLRGVKKISFRANTENTKQRFAPFTLLMPSSTNRLLASLTVLSRAALWSLAYSTIVGVVVILDSTLDSSEGKSIAYLYRFYDEPREICNIPLLGMGAEAILVAAYCMYIWIASHQYIKRVMNTYMKRRVKRIRGGVIFLLLSLIALTVIIFGLDDSTSIDDVNLRRGLLLAYYFVVSLLLVPVCLYTFVYVPIRDGKGIHLYEAVATEPANSTPPAASRAAAYLVEGDGSQPAANDGSREASTELQSVVV